MNRKGVLITLSIVFIVIFIASCTNNPTPDVGEEPEKSQQENPIEKDMDTGISVEEAKNIAFQEINDMNGIIVEYELEDYRDKYGNHEFEIQLNNERHEVKVDGKTGEIIKKQLKQNNHKVDEYDKYIGFDKAWKIVSDKIDKDNSLITKVELEDHDDSTERAYYEFEIKEGNKEYDIDIDAETGEILKRD